MIIRYESELRHHGVKGMRWGVRRARRLTDYTIGKRAAANSQSKSTRDYDDYDDDYSQPSWLQRHGKKLIIGAASAATLATGALIANAILKKKGTSLGKVTSKAFKDLASKGKTILGRLRKK